MYPPNAKLARVVDAEVEPLTLAQAKKYLRIDDDDTGDADDDLILDLIAAARLECENINDRSFILTSWRLTLDYLPFSATGGIIGPAIFGFPAISGARPGEDGSIILPMPPLVSVEAITYRDLDGSTRSIDVSPEAGEILVDPGTPGRIAPALNRSFPFSSPTIAAVNITYTAGYGPGPADVPRSVVAAMRLLVSHYYEHRTSDVETPRAVFNLLNATRWGGYA